MPRSNQTGGPWGSGPRRPPDLEEYLRRGQDRLRGLTSGGLGGRGFALIALQSSCGPSPGSSASSRTRSAWYSVSANSCARCSLG